MEPKLSLKIHKLETTPNVYDRILSRLQTRSYPIDDVKTVQHISREEFERIGEDTIKRYVAESIVDSLISSGYIEFEFEDSPHTYTDLITIKAKLKVIQNGQQQSSHVTTFGG